MKNDNVDTQHSVVGVMDSSTPTNVAPDAVPLPNPLRGDPAMIAIPTVIAGAIGLGLTTIGFVPAPAGLAAIPVILAATCLGLLIGTIWAAALGQNIVATLYAVFLGFYSSYVLLQLGLAHNWYGIPAGQVATTVAVYLICWLITIVVLTLATLRLPVIFTVLLGLVDVALALLLVSTYTGSALIQSIAGAVVFGFIAVAIYLYFYLKDEHYHDDRAEALDLAAALNEELRAIDTEGVDLLQIDEPVFHYHISRARRYGVEVMNRMVEGLRTPVIVHVCYGYAALIEGKSVNPAYAEVLSLLAQCNIWGISLEYEEPAHQPDVLQYCGDKHVILGLLNLGTERVETAEYIVSRLRAALEVVPAERLHPAPDCGMWHLPRETAFAKLRSLVLGTEMVRRELGLMIGLRNPSASGVADGL